jgi:hypothetical protein
MHKIILPTLSPRSELYCGHWPYKFYKPIKYQLLPKLTIRFVRSRPWTTFNWPTSQYVQWGSRFIGYRDVVMRWEWHSEIQNYGIRFSWTWNGSDIPWYTCASNIKVSYLVLSDHLRLLNFHPPCSAHTRNFRIEDFWGADTWGALTLIYHLSVLNMKRGIIVSVKSPSLAFVDPLLVIILSFGSASATCTG